jgi:acyl carrier protein phosphodiesterase
MNYLAHLHIASCANSNLLGNLLGDFVKGDPSENYPLDIVHGIRLHRRVDAFTDMHPLCLELKPIFPPKLRRFVPIVLDMVWDHCLAKQWYRYGEDGLEAFIARCRAEVYQDEIALSLPPSYQSVTGKMWQQGWLQSYTDWDSIIYAVQRLSHRRPRLGGLVECIPTLELHYPLLNDQFERLYPEVVADAQDFHRSLLAC